MKKSILFTAMMLLVLLAACSQKDNDADKDSQPAIPPTPATIPWQRPQTAISQETPLVQLTGLLRLHQQTVNDVAFSANGTRMASVGADNITAVWNLANGETLFIQSDNDGRRVFFGPNDETLITVNRDGIARVWTMDMSPPRKMNELLSFAGHDVAAGLVTQSPDRTLLAFGARSGGVRIWQIPAGQLTADIAAHNDAIQYLAFSPDNTMLVSLSADRGLRVWSVPDGRLLYDLVNPQEREVEQMPLRATFSPDSSRLAVANLNGIELWDMTTGESLYFIETAEHNASGALIFSPDGTLLVGCGLQPIIGIWAADSSDWVAGVPIPGQSCVSAAFSPDSTLLITLPQPGRELYLWNLANLKNAPSSDDIQLDVANRETMGLFAGPRFWNLAWSDDGRFIAVLDELGPIYILTAAAN
ncbi:MAG: hypothetical protein JXQ72_15025 [Anaerolineae bacterium]|nr:hypothetical protein [Anaerolineae bacterium]